MAKFELYKDAKGEYRWRLKSGNGQVIATGGEGYTSKAGALNGIERQPTALNGSVFPAVSLFRR